jgi:predicted O-methyltransferase YrrM
MVLRAEPIGDGYFLFKTVGLIEVMAKTIKNFFKAQSRKRKLQRYLKKLPSVFPGVNWQPFHEVTQYFHEKSLSTLDDQTLLYRMASRTPANGIAVEIGSWIGHSTSLIGLALRGPEARCYAVDAFSAMTEDDTEKDNFKSFLKRLKTPLSQRALFDQHIEKYGLSKRVVPIPFASAEAIQHLPVKANSVDFLYIDGGHTLDVVRKDISLYLPLVKTGGIVCFHDFNSYYFPDVTTAVWEEARKGAFAQFLELRSTTLALVKS